MIGEKRKAEDQGIQAPKRIKALDQDVVNKIAAGEIIVAPLHALKELIENAVDAGSTALEIVVKDGGLKLLQITDNGHGINRDDLPILCERFTTSKLKAFEDLSNIGTYGFRGEALASISHIAHLTITTRTADSSCAWRAHYADGRLAPAKPGQSSEAKPIAGRPGTQITVEDLFYNVPSRQRAFRSPSEEYAKILDVVGRYAVHCAGVAFSCKKYGEAGVSISTPANATTIDSIRQIHGSAVANELLQFEAKDAHYGFEATGWATNANYHVKKTTILLFINHRSVESTAIKKAIEQVYSVYLPKGGHPFVYLSLDIDPQRLDVNVHPTKREVNFLNEDEIIEQICSKIRDNLAKIDTSRTFATQSILPQSSRSNSNQNQNSHAASTQVQGKQGPSTPAKPYENNLVRTDPNLRKITSMLPPGGTLSSKDSDANFPSDQDYSIEPRDRTDCRLSSVKSLRAAVRDEMHAGLTETFASLTYVGPVDPYRRLAAMQSGVKLYLVDYGAASQELFYQIGLADFGNFGSIAFADPLDVRALINLSVDIERAKSQESDVEWDLIADTVTDQLVAKRDMLKEYFNLDVTIDGQLRAIPLLLKGYTPSLSKLPRFMMRLGPCVDWSNEKTCFNTFLLELAKFYALEQLPPYPIRKSTQAIKDVEMEDIDVEQMGPEETAGQQSSEEEEASAKRSKMERVLEHVLFPALRSRLVATKSLLSGVTEVANLKGLYRVFERC